MQTLYGIYVNNVGQVSVDVFSPKHTGINKWRMYFAVRPMTMARLRRIYAAHPKAFYISREWSSRRWKAYKAWGVAWTGANAGVQLALSLDSLETSVQDHENPQ